MSIDDDDDPRDHRATSTGDHGVLLEPHGAVGWAGLEAYLAAQPEHAGHVAISLETAHPAKFPDEVRALTGVDPPLPPSLAGLDARREAYGEIADGRLRGVQGPPARGRTAR